MHVIVSGRTVYCQQVSEWIQELDPHADVDFVTTPRDLERSLRSDAVPADAVVVVLDDGGDDRRTLAALTDVDAARAGDVRILCPPSRRDEVGGMLPAALRSQLRPHRREALQELVADAAPRDTLALAFEGGEPQELHFGCLVGESRAMHEVYRRLEKVARTDACCLVTGETGTGKEQVARAIHGRSARSEASFVPLNAGSIPRELIESQLFGHEKGAFTGAISRRKGVFECADRGTLLIDEIGELPVEVQPVFLRALQDGEITPVGADKAHHVDVRFVAATNRDLWGEVEAGRFREDLYYRLHVVPIALPPLRDRRSDIPRLIQHKAAEINERYGLSVRGMTRACLDALCAYRWPGNVRQLLHTLEQMMVLADDDVLDVVDLPPVVTARDATAADDVTLEVPEDGIDFYAETERFQRAILEQVLDRVAWNKNRAANLLKMNRTTLVERLKRLGLTQENCVGAA